MQQTTGFVSFFDEHTIFYLFKVTTKVGQKNKNKACALKLKQNIKTNLKISTRSSL